MPNNRWRQYHKVINEMNRYNWYHGIYIASVVRQGNAIWTPNGWFDLSAHKYVGHSLHG